MLFFLYKKGHIFTPNKTTEWLNSRISTYPDVLASMHEKNAYICTWLYIMETYKMLWWLTTYYNNITNLYYTRKSMKVNTNRIIHNTPIKISKRPVVNIVHLSSPTPQPMEKVFTLQLKSYFTWMFWANFWFCDPKVWNTNKTR